METVASAERRPARSSHCSSLLCEISVFFSVFCSKRRCLEPMVDSFEIAWSADEKIAPPEALWSRSSTKIAVNAHHSRRRPRGLLIVRREARSSGRRPLYHAAAPLPAQIPWRARCHGGAARGSCGWA